MTTTVSTTPYSKNVHRRLPLEGFARQLIALASLLLALAAPLHAEPTDIASLQVERGAEGVLLSAQLRFDLPNAVEDALLKGIPIFFAAEALLLRERWYWYDKEVASAARYMRLSYQPLTRRWRLQLSSTPIGSAGLALGQNFDTQEEALAAVQRISGWKIAEPVNGDPDRRYYVNLRFRLDTSQLPRPFQIGLVGQADWNISAARSVYLPPEPPR